MQNRSRFQIIFSVLLIFGSNCINAQSFKKGKFLISISEGTTRANFSTRMLGKDGKEKTYSENMDGIRDPLIIEYGITDKIGLGLSCGNDIFKVDPSVFYGFSLPSQKKVEAYTSEFNFEFNYHMLSNKRFDISSFATMGTFSVAIKGKESFKPSAEESGLNEFSYDYKAKGSIIRTGVRAKYYFYKRLGVLAMASVYSGSCSPEDVKTNTVGNGYSTQISGYALEFGFCCHLGKK
jgi:hypothetical protein